MARLFDDASSEYLEVDTAPTLGSAYTLSCWAYVDNMAAAGILWGMFDSAGDNIHRTWLDPLGTSDRARFLVQDAGGTATCESTTSMSVNTWHHVCGVTRSATDKSVFLDAGGEGTAINNIAINQPNRVSIGRLGDSTPGNYASGRLAECAAWNVDLSDAEIASLAEGISPLTIRPANLIFYAPLIRDEDHDVVGGRILTPFNTPTVAEHAPVMRIQTPVTIPTPTSADATGPVITLKTAAEGADGPTEADITFTSDEAGTYDVYCSSSASELESTIASNSRKSGNISAGANSIDDIPGLIPGTATYIHLRAEDASTNVTVEAFGPLTTTAYTESAIYDGLLIQTDSILSLFGGEITDVHDGGNNTAYMQDASTTLSASNTLVGDILRNITDDNVSAINTNTTTRATPTTVGDITSGTDDDFDNGDKWHITAGTRDAPIASADTMYCESQITVTSEAFTLKSYYYDTTAAIYSKMYVLSGTATGAPDGLHDVTLSVKGVPTLTFASAVANPGARFETVNGALPTSGTTDLTITDFGTPKAVLLFVSYGTVDAAIVAHALISVGAMDDTTEGSASFSAQDVVATSNTNRTLYSSFASGADPTAEATIEFDISGTLITDGVQLSINSAPTGAYLCTALLIGGDDVDLAEVIIQDDLGAASGDTAISLSKVWASPPDLLLGFTQNGNTIPNDVQAGGLLSFGFSDFTNHGSVSIGANDAQSGEYATALVSDTVMLSQSIGGSVLWSGYPHTPTTSNFQFNLDASAGNDIAIFVAVGLASGYTASIDTLTVPTDDDVTISTSVNPTFNLTATLEGPTALDTNVSTVDVAPGFTLFDGTTVSSISASVSDTAAKSVHSDSLALVNGAGAAGSVVGTPSFDGSNVIWTTSTRPSADILGISLSVGTPVVTAANKYSTRKWIMWGGRRF